MEETKEKIIYPEWMDDYFKQKEVIVKRLPDDYRVIDKQSFPNKTIKSTQQFVKYIQTELKFWSYDKSENNPYVGQYKRVMSDVLSLIEDCRKFKTATSDKLNNFTNSISRYIRTCEISSATKIAMLFKKFANKGTYFFYGFVSAITSKPGNEYIGREWIEGFYYGMKYRDVLKEVERMTLDCKMTFQDALKNAEDEFNNLIQYSTNLFHSQETEILETKNSFFEELKKQKEQFSIYKDEKEKKLSILEKTYEEKLRLSKPAEYWSQMSNYYSHRGIGWFAASSILACLIIGLLIVLVVHLPNLFSANEYWMDTVKNTALVSVITGIAIYILRITVKMSLSSFHLSRDAKEREQLSYFYLSLIESEAVTEKERGLIINALFSRSDTGLLKGDSAPSMPINVKDLIEK